MKSSIKSGEKWALEVGIADRFANSLPPPEMTKSDVLHLRFFTHLGDWSKCWTARQSGTLCAVAGKMKKPVHPAERVDCTGTAAA